ncbi:GGDEF domain-containing protein [Edaphobacter paludis]|uniref:diguanylate cyclase n=1 Tax=Edaphobacter paludis TaxID=3035702 RepID=A0AAU7DDG6_9BACT
MQRGFNGPIETRRSWNLIAAGLVLWAVGQAGLSYLSGAFDLRQMLAPTWNFFFFAYGIPIILALSSANENVGLRSFLWPDGAIAAIVVVLANLQLFSSAPGWSRLVPLSVTDLGNIYNIQNVLLACACTLRLLLSSRGEKRTIYSILSGFLWINALVWAILSSFKEMPVPIRNALWELPFLLLLTALAFWPQSHGSKVAKGTGILTVGFLVDNLSPVLLTIGVIILASEIKREHIVFKVLSMTIAVVLFGIRTAIRQSDYFRGHLQIVESQQALEEANVQLTRDAVRDGLTGAYNRRYFDQTLTEEWKRASRAQQPLSLIMVDVDHFKSLNDHYGHPTGDAVLRAIVRTLTTVLRRPNDLLARYGGEEFAVILPGTDLKGAMLVAEHMRASIEAREIPNDRSGSGRVVTLSVGVASDQPAIGGTQQELLDRVDSALYRAKSQGRNRICS